MIKETVGRSTICLVLPRLSLPLLTSCSGRFMIIIYIFSGVVEDVRLRPCCSPAVIFDREIRTRQLSLSFSFQESGRRGIGQNTGGGGESNYRIAVRARVCKSSESKLYVHISRCKLDTGLKVSKHAYNPDLR